MTLSVTRFDEHYAQTYPIATLGLDVAQLVVKNPGLVFVDAYDDLDYLKYCLIDVLPGRRVALVCHERSPIPGIGICIDPAEQNGSSLILVATLCNLGLKNQSLTWVHPDYLQ
jgi:hypothetical protein